MIYVLYKLRRQRTSWMMMMMMMMMMMIQSNLKLYDFNEVMSTLQSVYDYFKRFIREISKKVKIHTLKATFRYKIRKIQGLENSNRVKNQWQRIKLF